MMTPVLRAAMAVAPMHVVTAPEAGTGKSYLLDVASMVATGHSCAVIAVSPNERETESRLVGAALSGHPIIALDNVSSLLMGEVLAAVQWSADEAERLQREAEPARLLGIALQEGRHEELESKTREEVRTAIAVLRKAGEAMHRHAHLMSLVHATMRQWRKHDGMTIRDALRRYWPGGRHNVIRRVEKNAV
jgi:hypothetical protein